MSRAIMIMTGGTGGHIFDFGRVLTSHAARLTCAVRKLAYAENVRGSAARGGLHG